MVEHNGTTYERDGRGKYRCPQRCGHPDYPQPSWTTEKGFLKHLESCQGSLTWTPEPTKEHEKFSDCPDCGKTIWKMTSFWEMTGGAFVCIDCYLPYYEQGKGFHSCAGLEIAELALEA